MKPYSKNTRNGAQNSQLANYIGRAGRPRKFVACQMTKEVVGIPFPEPVLRALSRHEAVKAIVCLQKERQNPESA